MFMNIALREINLKLVYYGCGLGGKTTNLKWLHFAAPSKSELTTLATEADRTLFFDFMPLEIGTVNDYKVRLHLYTVPGQVFYEATRRLVVRGADGVVLVADSQEERMDANVESLSGLRSNLSSHGLDLDKLPYVVQLNKRDLPTALPVDEMKSILRFKEEPFVEAVATSGEGVEETLRQLTRQVMKSLRESNKLAGVLAGAGVNPQQHPASRNA
jgi:signal recognition particle receptor subunit beta